MKRIDMLTMDDVARKAGVARSTVSHILNGRHTGNVRIPEATRERVLNAARELGYRPNALARSVRSGKSSMIGYLVDTPHYEPYWKTIIGALTEAEKEGFTLKLLSVTAETFVQRVQQCMELRVSGIIARVYHEKSALFEEAERAGIPVVTVDDDIPHDFGTRVTADDSVGCRDTITHLLQFGHRKIAFIAGGFVHPPLAMVPSRDIHYWREMAKHGLEIPEGYITRENMRVYGIDADTELDTSTVIAATNSLLEHPMGRPTAIVCWRDETALIAMQTCRQAGLRIPEDISIIGFSDIGAARLSAPSLSTCRSPWGEMGRIAVRQLIGRLEETTDVSPQTVLIPSEFIPRQSSGPAPQQS